MTDHSDLVAEIASVEKMTTPERLKLAKKRRSQQLKRFANYEKQLEKDKTKKNKQSQNQKRQHRKKARVKFIHNIMLLEAAARNDLDEVRRLLLNGVKPDVTNEDGLTALHQCCIDDSEEMLKLLLEFGANVNARDSEMWTPLHAAATCGHVHLCKSLIDKGAEVLAVNADGNMPYDICEDEVALDYIETEMAKRGITQEEIDMKRLETERKMLTDLKKLADANKSLEYRDRHRATPLHIAAANGYIEVVEFLLDHHVNLEARDEDSWMPVHAAACWLQPEVLEILVKAGADIDAKTLRNGETPFDLAEDPDVKQKILDLKDELETHRASRPSHPRNKRNNTRGHYASTGSLYSSNGSLNEKAGSGHGAHGPHNHSASLRRTSMRGEKKPLFKKEAKEEALHFGMFSTNNEDDETADYTIDNKENLPATNIDDVKISLIDDEPDKYQNDFTEKSTNDHPAPVIVSKGMSPNNEKNREQNNRTSHKENGNRESQKPRESVSPQGPIKQQDSHNRDLQNDRLRVKSAENNELQKSENARNSQEKRNSQEPPTIHIQMGHADASLEKRNSNSPQDSRRDKDSRTPPRETPVVNGDSSPAPAHTQNPQLKQVQGQSSVGRTPSFKKNRDSQRQRAGQRDDQSPTEANRNSYGVTGGHHPQVPNQTLAELKKQRSEQHNKFTGGGGLDAHVQNLFLHSLSGDGKKYSMGSSPSGNLQSPQAPSNKESSQNGRTVKNNNNNNSTPSRPPTYISDNGPLRRFSAPTSAPVIGDDNKFKSNCCVVM